MFSRYRIAVVMVALLALGGGVIAFQYWRDPQRRFERAQAALRAGKLDVVRAEADALSRYSFYEPHRHFLRGALLLRDGQTSAALSEFGFSVDHPDLERDSLVLSGQAFYQMRMPGNAKILWEKALWLDQNCADAHRWMGVLAYDIGAMDRALAHFKRVSELDAKDPRADRMIGMIHWMYNRPEQAVGHYRECLRRSSRQPDIDDVRMELAESETQIHQYAAAQETLRTCNRSARQQTLLADCYLGDGKLDEALRAAEQALSIQPNYFLALRVKGTILLGRGQAEEAAPVLASAAKENPNDYETRFKLAAALRRLGKASEAAKEAQRGTELRETWQEFFRLNSQAVAEPTNSAIRFQLGNLAEKLDRPDLAMTWYRATLAIAPSHPEAIERLRQLEASLPQAPTVPAGSEGPSRGTIPSRGVDR